MADQYGYKNADDSMRFVIHKSWWDDDRPLDFEWNVDIWTRSSDGKHRVETSVEARDVYFTRRRDAKDYFEQEYGPLRSFTVEEWWTEGWEPHHVAFGDLAPSEPAWGRDNPSKAEDWARSPETH